MRAPSSQSPAGEDVLERAHSGFELFNTALRALVFIADENGQILLHTGTTPLRVQACPRPTLTS